MEELFLIFITFFEVLDLPELEKQFCPSSDHFTDVWIHLFSHQNHFDFLPKSAAYLYTVATAGFLLLT